MFKKTPVSDSLVIKREPAKASQLDGKGPGSDPKQFTRTIYDSNGKLLDDGFLPIVAQSYWDAFVDPRQAKELKRRLSIVESPEYIPGSENFLDMDWIDTEDGEDE